MSIADRQIHTALNDIIGGIMRSGRLPTLDEVRRKLDKHFSQYVLGQPTMRLRSVEYREKSNVNIWNDTINEIYNDLSLLYEEIVSKSELIVSHFDYAETERRRLDRRLNELITRLQDLLVLSGASATYSHAFTESFNSLAMVDLNKSNCFVDLRAREALPMSTKIGTSRIDLSDAKVEYQLITADNVIANETLSPLTNILDDMQNTAWSIKTLTSQVQRVAHQVTITPHDAADITRISIHPHNTDRVNLSVSVTEDGGNWRTLYSKHTADPVHIDMQPSKILALRIVISKDDSDGRELRDGQLYEAYYFGLATVALLRMGFEDVGSLYSRPITITDSKNNPVSINKIVLDVDHDIDSPNNWIKYYLALDSESPQWIQVTPVNIASEQSLNKPPVLIDLKSIAVMSRLRYSASAIHDDYGIFNGLPVWPLAQLAADADEIIDSTIQLMCGEKQWRMDAYTHKWDDETQHTPSGADWVVPPSGIELDNISSTYVNINADQNIPASLVAKDPLCSYKWTVHATCDTQKEIRTYLKLTQPGRITMYINNEEIIELSGKEIAAGDLVQYAFTMAEGLNVIQVLFYNRSNNGPCTIDLGFRPLRDMSRNLFAEKNPLERVSEFDLCYNVRDTDISKFALSDSKLILINDTAKRMDGKYVLSYSYYPYGNRKRLLFRADMGKQPGTVRPPKLKSYSIRVV